jgi:hypothetical protein
MHPGQSHRVAQPTKCDHKGNGNSQNNYARARKSRRPQFLCLCAQFVDVLHQREAHHTTTTGNISKLSNATS